MSDTDQTSASPGWYPDPERAGILRYWDGTRWTDDRVAPSTSEETRRRGFPRWVWLVLGVVVLGAVGLGGLLLVGLDQTLTHDLVDADFESGTAPFETGSGSDYRLDEVDGTYRITRITDGRVAPATSFGEFARVAFNFELSALVVSIDDPRAAEAGVGCVETGRHTSDLSMFVFLVGADHLRLVHVDASGGVDEVIARKQIRTGLGAGDRIGLQCSVVGPVGRGDRVDLTASVNGHPVFDVRHELRNDSGFDGMVLAFGDPHAGHGATFDEVRAHVPE